MEQDEEWQGRTMKQGDFIFLLQSNTSPTTFVSTQPSHCILLLTVSEHGVSEALSFGFSPHSSMTFPTSFFSIAFLIFLYLEKVLEKQGGAGSLWLA